jgi:hypothetical protein
VVTGNGVSCARRFTGGRVSDRIVHYRTCPLWEAMCGRRHLRSNNSWMHNVPVLVKGKDRCTLLIHPDDPTASASATARWRG